MNSDSNKLLPAYRRFYKTPVKGKRTVISIALDQPKISAKSNVNLTFPKLSQNVCVNPNSIYISALLENTNTKSWFKNNLGRLLYDELQIRIGSEPVYDNKKESLIMVYKDLWLPDERREDMSEYGIASENLRKLMSGDDSASSSNKDDNALFKARGKRIKIKLEKILNNQGLFAPSALNGGVEFNFKTPDARKRWWLRAERTKTHLRVHRVTGDVLPSRDGLHGDRIPFHGHQLPQTYQSVERPNVHSRNH